jgi:membrane-bound lytic murein transglycosylase B
VRAGFFLATILAVGLGAQTPAPSSEGTRPSFAQWLQEVRAEALARGIRQEVVDQALNGVEEPLPVVLERDRKQAETVLALERYISRQMTAARIRDGRRLVAAHRQTIDAISAKYGIPASIIAGVWGVESNFGRFSGTRPTITALATLAWDPRRSSLFREELFKALEILNRGDIAVGAMRGSWAGAMGQPQFMPSSYLEFAVDHDGDNRRDIWSTPADIFASIANYLRGHGWNDGQSWGREVSVPKAALTKISSTIGRREGSCKAVRDMTVRLPLAEWRALGVKAAGGRALPDAAEEASLISGSSRHFLVTPSYDALLEYNCAQAYALTVSLLGDEVLRPAPAPAARPAVPARKAPASRPRQAQPKRRRR